LLDSLFAPDRYWAKRIFEGLKSKPYLYENTPFERIIRFIKENIERVTAHYLEPKIPSTNNLCENFVGFFRRDQYGKGLRSEREESGWFKLIGIGYNFCNTKGWKEKFY
jgi:hypothetical protein